MCVWFFFSLSLSRTQGARTSGYFSSSWGIQNLIWWRHWHRSVSNFRWRRIKTIVSKEVSSRGVSLKAGVLATEDSGCATAGAQRERRVWKREGCWCWKWKRTDNGLWCRLLRIYECTCAGKSVWALGMGNGKERTRRWTGCTVVAVVGGGSGGGGHDGDGDGVWLSFFLLFIRFFSFYSFHHYIFSFFPSSLFSYWN